MAALISAFGGIVTSFFFLAAVVMINRNIRLLREEVAVQREAIKALGDNARSLLIEVDHDRVRKMLHDPSPPPDYSDVDAELARVRRGAFR